MYEQRQFIIFPNSQVSKVDFSQVLETSLETLRFSVDGSKTFIKWDKNVPGFITDLDSFEGPYTYEEMIGILATDEWTQNKL